MKSCLQSLGAALLTALPPALALPVAPNLEAAKLIAQAEERTILLNLTGKDWCPGCIYLKEKILDSALMEESMGKRYLLVEIDYPRHPDKIAAIPMEERTARANILKRYKVSGLPCVIYMDADGLPFAVYSQYTQTPQQYIDTIMAKAEAVRHARDEAFAKAATLQGMEKARALIAALELLPEVCRSQYTALLHEIRDLDPDNILGYSYLEAAAHQRVEQLKAWEHHLRTFIEGLNGMASSSENVAAIMDMCEAYLQRPGLLPELRQKIIAVIADGYGFQRNIPMLYATLHRGLNEAPESDSSDAEKFRRTIEYYDHYLLEELKMTQAAHEAAKPYLRRENQAPSTTP